MSLLYLVHIHSVSVLYFGEQQGKQISSEPFSWLKFFTRIKLFLS
jgi:hypothetical protein